MKPANQRQFRRINFHAPAVIRLDNITIHGEVDNICNRGIYIKTPATKRPAAADTAMLSISMTEGQTSITITVPARLVRSADEGMAFYSDQLNLHPILHLEHLFIYRKGQENKLTEDFCEYISGIPLAYNFSHSG